MRIVNDNILDMLDGTDMTSDIVSEPISLEHIANYSIQLVFTGSPNGSFTLEGSCDPGKKGARHDEPISVSNWSTVSGSSQAISAAGNHLYDVSNCGYSHVRVKWTDTSSASTPVITVARFNGKGF